MRFASGVETFSLWIASKENPSATGCSALPDGASDANANSNSKGAHEIAAESRLANSLAPHRVHETVEMFIRFYVRPLELTM